MQEKKGVELTEAWGEIVRGFTNEVQAGSVVDGLSRLSGTTNELPRAARGRMSSCFSSRFH